MSEDRIPNVKILLAKVLHSMADFISDISELEDAEANLQNAAINEIDAIYSQTEKNKITKLPIQYEWIYLGFINDPDPWMSFYSTRKVDYDDPDLLIDKSEDNYLDKEAKFSSTNNKLPKIV